VRLSNLEDFGDTAPRLEAAIDDLQDATEWLLAQVSDQKLEQALAGATPYQRLFGLALTGCYLAKGALATPGDGGEPKRIALCRFAAENIIAETAALKDRVIHGADSLLAARVVLS